MTKLAACVAFGSPGVVPLAGGELGACAGAALGGAALGVGALGSGCRRIGG